jgi:hypothetical protein
MLKAGDIKRPLGTILGLDWGEIQAAAVPGLFLVGSEDQVFSGCFCRVKQ